MKKIIIEVPDEFDIKVELSKGVVYLEGRENEKFCYAEFDRKGVYELNCKDGEIEMRVDTPNKVAGIKYDVPVIDGSILVVKQEDKKQVTKKPHPNPFTRKFKRRIK